MRKQQQKQILKLIETVGKAQSAGLYADAWDGALAVSEFIKGVDGKGTSAVALLEEYCELLSKADKVEQALREQLIKIENSVREDLKPAKIEIVFICYNASMSDSVLAIYQAAKADPNCEAVWLPIPYFELNSDGTMGPMRFDGVGCYGDNVVCSDWRKYDIKARHPDIIVTYAPYDEGNYVTRVHPDFFCKRLRELTDLLVYVPYFISADKLEEHFCTLSGCIYAHKVVVQSEKIRDQYVQGFKKVFGNQLGRPEEKFVALGSPKFDAALNTRRENILIMDTWERLIGQMGERRRKVVLYNTSVSAILAGNEQYLKKLRQVLDTFRRRDDVVLLWRPHPLSEATFSSMRPRLLAEYEQIIAEYKREGWGIFDDSLDIHRAIAVSDVYYGDGSSIVPLYGITGKPIVMQHIDVFTMDISNYSIAFESLYDDGEYLWFSAIDFNALFRMNKQTRKPEVMGRFPDAGLSLERINSSLVYHNGKLYFAPFNGSEFYVYDCENKAFQTIDVPDYLSAAIEHSEFISVVAYQQYIFYIGYTFKGIIRYDSENGDIRCCDNWVSEIDRLIGGREHFYFIYVHPVGNRLYCPCVCAKAVLIFDMNTCEYEIIELNSRTDGFRSIAYDGKSFWLASEFDSKYLVQWDGKSRNVIEHHNPNVINDGLWDVTTVDGSAWFLPYSCSASYRANDGIIEFVDELCNMHPDKCGTEWCGHTVAGQWIYLHKNGGSGNLLVSFNTVTRELRKEQLLLEDELCDEIALQLRQSFRDRICHCHTWKDCVIEESFVFNLNSYLDFIVHDYDTLEAQALHNQQVELFKQFTASPDGTAGQVIYDYIKGFLLG